MTKDLDDFLLIGYYSPGYFSYGFSSINYSEELIPVSRIKYLFFIVSVFLSVVNPNRSLCL